MALSDDEQATLKRLKTRLDNDTRGTSKCLGFEKLDAYFRGMQRLVQLGLAVPDELHDFVTIVAWPRTYVRAIADRCRVDGFRLSGQPEADDGLWEVWEANELDVESRMGLTDSMVFGRSYVCVGAGDDPDVPLVTVESPLQMVHEWSPRQRRVTSAARFYVDESTGTKVNRATFYTPDFTSWLVKEGRGWVEEDRDDHELGRCLVEVMANGPRTHNRYGESEMLPIIGLTDAAARGLTLAQVATEVMGLPQRTAAGLVQSDFVDPESGEPLTKWESYFGAVWATKNADAKFHQFSAAELSNFSGMVNHYAQLVAGITGLPMRYMGQLSDNPPSADGIRADEARIVLTAEEKNAVNSGATWQRVMRTVNLVRTGEDDPELARMETLHANPATPTQAQTADATVKLYAAGLISRRQAQRDIGYSSIQITNMEKDFADEANDPVLERVARQFTAIGQPNPNSNGQPADQPVAANAGT